MADTVTTEIFHSKYANQKINQILLQSVLYRLETFPPNNFWPKLIKALNYWFNIPGETLGKIEEIIRIIYVANNVVVDVSEDMPQHKGVVAPNSMYGGSDAVNSAFYSTFIVLDKVRDLENFRAVKFATDLFLQLTRGQSMEILWRDNVVCPTEEEYMQMVLRITGSIVHFTVQLMQLFSGNRADFTELSKLLGKLFHIHDDYINSKSLHKYLFNCDGRVGITLGKFTFPMIHAIQTRPDDDHILNILRRRGSNEEVIKYCLSLVNEFGSFAYTRQILLKLIHETEEEMKKFEENPLMTEIFEGFKIEETE